MKNKSISGLLVLSSSAFAHSGHVLGPHIHNNNGQTINALSIILGISLCTLAAVALKIKTKKA